MGEQLDRCARQRPAERRVWCALVASRRSTCSGSIIPSRRSAVEPAIRRRRSVCARWESAHAGDGAEEDAAAAADDDLLVAAASSLCSRRRSGTVRSIPPSDPPTPTTGLAPDPHRTDTAHSPRLRSRGAITRLAVVARGAQAFQVRLVWLAVGRVVDLVDVDGAPTTTAGAARVEAEDQTPALLPIRRAAGRAIDDIARSRRPIPPPDERCAMLGAARRAGLVQAAATCTLNTDAVDDHAAYNAARRSRLGNSPGVHAGTTRELASTRRDRSWTRACTRRPSPQRTTYGV